MANSRVGRIIKIKGYDIYFDLFDKFDNLFFGISKIPSVSLNKKDIDGIKYANVFPLPVWAQPTKS